MEEIRDRLAAIRKKMAAAAGRAGRNPESVRLVAVSKKVSPDLIQQAMREGQTLFGENYLQEALAKIPLVDSSAKWHFIGRLQSNKARQAAARFDVIETVDRLKIAAALNEYGLSVGRKITVLLQVNIGGESQKSGVAPEKAAVLAEEVAGLGNITVAGLMAMPPYHDDPEKARPYFGEMRLLGEKLMKKGLLGKEGTVELSMGMSGDFEVAIEEGATLVRVGTAIFGERS